VGPEKKREKGSSIRKIYTRHRLAPVKLAGNRRRLFLGRTLLSETLSLVGRVALSERRFGQGGAGGGAASGTLGEKTRGRAKRRPLLQAISRGFEAVRHETPLLEAYPGEGEGGDSNFSSGL